jgi:hypothetical protein
VLLREVVAAQDRRRRAARRRAALVARERIEDLRRGHHLLDREHVLEQRVGVLRRVLPRLRADLREGLALRAVLPPVLAPGAAEHLRRRRGLVEALHLVHQVGVLVERVRAIGPLGRQRALLHLLEAHREHALGEAAGDGLRASISALEPVEQLLLTLKTGMPVRPTRRPRAGRRCCRRRRSRRRPARPRRTGRLASSRAARPALEAITLYSSLARAWRTSSCRRR